MMYQRHDGLAVTTLPSARALHLQIDDLSNTALIAFVDEVMVKSLQLLHIVMCATYVHKGPWEVSRTVFGSWMLPLTCMVVEIALIDRAHQLFTYPNFSLT